MYTSSHREIILYYDASSRNGTQTLAYAKSHGVPVHDIDITKDGITGTQLIDLSRKLGKNLQELINTDHPNFKEHYGSMPEDENDVIVMIQSHPEIMKTPLAIKGDKIKIITTPTDIVNL